MEGHFKAFKAVSVITSLSFLNFFLSIFLQIILAAKFGANVEMDAYLLAIAIPVVIIALIMNTAEVVFVPFLKDIELSGSKTNLAKIENLIFNFLFLILFAVSILNIILAPKIIHYLAPGFSVEAKKVAITLFRIIMPSIIFGGLTALLISIYHSREKFTTPAFVNIVNNLIIIITFLIFYPFIKIKALALGMLLGYIVQFSILFPVLLSKNRGYSFSLTLGNSKLYKISFKFLQILIGGGILGLIIPFERLLASRLPEGSISYLGYAGKIITLLLVIPVTAIPVVLLPNLSRHFSMQNLDKLRSNLSLGIRFTFFIIFPICILLYIFRTQIVYILLERGSFDRSATVAVANTLFCYLGLLLGASLAAIIGRGFFAIHNTVIPAVIMSVSFLFYILIAIPLSKLFSYGGLAFSMSITVLLGLAVDLLILRRLLKGIGGKVILISMYKIILSSLIMGISLWFISKGLTLVSIFGDKFIMSIKMVFITLVGFIIYGACCFLLKSDEISFIYNIIPVKLFKR